MERRVEFVTSNMDDLRLNKHGTSPHASRLSSPVAAAWEAAVKMCEEILTSAAPTARGRASSEGNGSTTTSPRKAKFNGSRNESQNCSAGEYISPRVFEEADERHRALFSPIASERATSSSYHRPTSDAAYISPPLTSTSTAAPPLSYSYSRDTTTSAVEMNECCLLSAMSCESMDSFFLFDDLLTEGDEALLMNELLQGGDCVTAQRG
jgi:hypothetical protein